MTKTHRGDEGGKPRFTPHVTKELSLTASVPQELIQKRLLNLVDALENFPEIFSFTMKIRFFFPQ
jgi:hypothetical protein